ncbi:MAG: rhomboid family intramembrane serine protease [Candidatus Baltobacteraceae bacterium]
MITRFLILANIVAFAWEVAVAGPGMFSGFGGGGIATVLRDGALWPEAALQDHQWWRILTSAFLHAGLIHIAVNMFSLWILGRFIETFVGSFRMALIYSFSLVASGLGVIYFSPAMTPTLGASGAIFGLFGALFAIGFKLGKPGMQLIRDNIGILVINLVMTFTISGISKSAHIAGLFAGFLIAFAIFFPPRRVAPVVVDATGNQYETEYQAPPTHLQQ